MSTNKYPLDFDALTKGSRLEINECEHALGCLQSSPRYQFKLMGLCRKIEKELRDRGTIVTARTDHGAIVICDDSEASSYNTKGFARGRRKMARHHFRLVGVDRGKLTAEEQAKHDREVLTQGAMLLAMKETKLRLTLAPAKRNTPKMIEQEGNGR